MKRLFKLTIFLILIFPFNVKADDVALLYTFKTHLQIKGGSDRRIPQKDNDCYRSPIHPILITISQVDGVQVSQVCKNDILSYSIYDEEETCLATFTDEADFVDFVFSTTGEVEIRIELADYYLCGWLQL